MKPSKDVYTEQDIKDALSDTESELCKQFYADLPKCNYFLLYIPPNGTHIKVHSIGSLHLEECDTRKPELISGDAIVAKLKNQGLRYVVMKLAYKTEDGRNTGKMWSFLWVPDGSNVKEKMVYASSVEAVKKALNLDEMKTMNDKDDVLDGIGDAAKKK